MSNLGAVHLVFYLYEVSPHPHSHFISSEICKERKSRRSALDFGAVEVCLLNSHAFFPSFLGTPFCTVDIIRNSRNCPYTMTQNPWNHASDWGHGSQLSHSFPFMFAWTSTLASLLILITTSEAQGSRGWEPRGGIWRTVLGRGGPEARPSRISELWRNFRHRQIQSPMQSRNSIFYCIPESWSISAYTPPGTEAHYLLIQALLFWRSSNYKEFLSFLGTQTCCCSNFHAVSPHLPLRALKYWKRVICHHACQSFL